MVDVSSLVNSAPTPSPQGSSLASLLPNGGQLAPSTAPTPAPTRAQAIAGYHRMQETKRLMGRILENPKTGHANIRPLVLDAGATLVGEKIMSLAELMSGLSDFPGADNPLGQKKWVQHLVAVNGAAQRKLLQDHRAANTPDWQHGTPWSADNHSDNMAALMAHYPSQN